MRFFKYLVFFLLINTSVSAAVVWTTASNMSGFSGTGDSPVSACQNLLSKLTAYGYTSVDSENIAAQNNRYCFFKKPNSNTSYQGSQLFQKTIPDKCPESGTPQATYFANNSPIPTQTCKANPDGTFCVHKYIPYPNKKDPLVITTNAGQQIILNSVSSIPSPSCTPIFHKNTCDSNDPYGGCYKPPDDDCNRLADGSIYCPPDTPEPEPSDSCNGATYCKRPPQGCGKGYVSGKLNGELICIKTSPSNGGGSDGDGGGSDGDGGGSDGDGGGSNTASGSGSSTSTNTTTNSDGSQTTTTTTTVNNFSIDLSPVVNAVKQVSSDIKNLKNELITSVTELGQKLDRTNTKIDTSNSHLSNIKDSSLRQEELLKEIRDKTVSDGGSTGGGTATDLTGVHTRLDAIKQGIDQQNSSDKEFLDMIKDKNYGTENGDFTGDSKIEILEQTNAPEMKGNILNANAACPAPYVINYDLLGSRSMSFSWDIFCSAASFFRPVFLFLGMFIGFKIATGTYKDS